MLEGSLAKSKPVLQSVRLQSWSSTRPKRVEGILCQIVLKRAVVRIQLLVEVHLSVLVDWLDKRFGAQGCLLERMDVPCLRLGQRIRVHALIRPSVQQFLA